MNCMLFKKEITNNFTDNHCNFYTRINALKFIHKVKSILNGSLQKYTGIVFIV